MTDTHKDDKKTSGSSLATKLIVLLMIVAAAGLIVLLFWVSRTKVDGTLEGRGGAGGDWTAVLDECHTSYDLKPHYKGVQISATGSAGHQLRVLRNVEDVILGDTTVEITHGPNEECTQKDLDELAKYTSQKWETQLVVPSSKTPIRITPEMCSRFHLEMRIATTNPKYSKGKLDLACELPDGSTMKAVIEIDDCL